MKHHYEHKQNSVYFVRLDRIAGFSKLEFLLQEIGNGENIKYSHLLVNYKNSGQSFVFYTNYVFVKSSRRIYFETSLRQKSRLLLLRGLSFT